MLHPCRRAAAGILCLLIFLAHSPAQTSAPPAPELPELTKLQDAYQAEQHEKLDAPFEAGLQRLNESYRTTLEAAFKKATAQGQLDQALALRNETQRFAEARLVPAIDEPGLTPEVTQYRTAWRAESARLEQQKRTTAGTLIEAQTGRLRQLEKELTRAAKIEEAQMVRAAAIALAAQVPPPPAAAATVAAAPMPSRPVAAAAPHQPWNPANAKTAGRDWIGKTVRLLVGKDDLHYVQLGSVVVKTGPLVAANPDTSLFVIRKGGEPDSFSFELKGETGSYLRHQGFNLKFSKGTNKDCTFRVVKPEAGNEGFSLHATNFPNHCLSANDRDGISLVAVDKLKDPQTAVFFIEFPR